jgi:hypothetical protein
VRLHAKRVQASNAEETAVPSIVHEVIRSPGQPLDPAVRAFMEPHFGYDLSQVRVHADPRAADSARALNALAYTVGRDVVFGTGQNTMGSNEGRKLIAHELTHVVQQGFTTQAIQRKDDKKKKPDTNPTLVFDEIKKRNPDLAELITPQSIDFASPKEPPALKGGSLKDGEEHIWKFRIRPQLGLERHSKITPGEVKKTKLKDHTQVTHFYDIFWGLPVEPEAEFFKQTKSEDKAWTLSVAEPLFHELLHARIIMERDPHWTSPRTQVSQDYTNLMQIANVSPAMDNERKALKQQIIHMLAATQRTAKGILGAKDGIYEFLVHEKFDADTEGKAFGKNYTNVYIAEKYSQIVAWRYGVPDLIYNTLRNNLVTAAAKLFDKLDQAAKPSTPSTPTSSSPAIKQPEK